MYTSLPLHFCYMLAIIRMYTYVRLVAIDMIVSFCGHADYLESNEDEIRLLEVLEKLIQDNQVEFFLGGYGGFDAFAYRCAKKYQQLHSSARLVFVTPYFDEWFQNKIDTLCKQYDQIVYPELEKVPKKFAILKRNEWMVERCDCLICYVNRHFGGAYKTLLYAYKHKKTYENLYQGDFCIE